MLFARIAMVAALSAAWFLSGCASSAFKARQEQREKIATNSGLFCEFVNGEQHTDVDVELTMQMAKRCDTTRHFTITNYKTASEMFGVIYCCQTPSARKIEARYNPPPAPRPVAKAPEAAPSPAPASVAPAAAAPADEETPGQD